ncbi:hypothetical protein FEM48_Zijuj08G0201100 [Ziziphus jujuba var. spinosa]|uniref:Cysteine protease n=1 Tax=Ziziphus jujuba var. spinosa TaxID=714518 RepID=A0A978V144_ZIZJJ|nr:hypothetical protein FEM48_Zijuj08G0201100 [Ziziphus jujuba var. spinosa]
MINLVASAFSIFESHAESSNCEKKGIYLRRNGWTAALKKVLAAVSMRRFHECILRSSRTGISSSSSDIWLLGVCYKVVQDDSTEDSATNNGLAEFEQDFSSRILITYRKGFNAIGDSNYTSDVNWGCMLRSSQMLVAQALLFHRLGRSWRKPLHKPFEQEYIEILHLFGDSEASSFSIHNLLQAGKAYGLTVGSWVGPYAMCRTWETLVRFKREEDDYEDQLLPMAVYVVSGDEDGERGGAPVLCIEDASRHCFEFSRGRADWMPILLLVPLVLGLEKVNPRYIPSLRATFAFPQSLGIMGGRPGASTYIVGVQDEKAYYLDPHEFLSVCGLIVIRGTVEVLLIFKACTMLLFYCLSDDFDDFCFRASKLAEESKGAPLFTVSQIQNSPKPVSHNNVLCNSSGFREDDLFDVLAMNDEEGNAHEDGWQLL